MARRKRKRWYPKPGKQVHYDVGTYNRIVERIAEEQLEWPMDTGLIRELRDQLDVLWARMDDRSRKLILEKWGDGRGVVITLDPRGAKTEGR